jgi:ABC-2 type transport system ATP-binding protein
MTDAIRVQDLTKTFGKSGSGLLAVDHITFGVEKGQVFGFLGPNGAGKTTTQRMLTTLLEPTSGRILIEGHDLSVDRYPAQRAIGLVPEESNVYTELSGWQNLMFTGRLYRMQPAQRESRARELLEIFGLWDKREVKAENYSKGMRRRLSIAMAVIHSPRLLFLDEPTPGLDAQSTRTIHELIRRLNAEGTTIFLTTHQIEEANQLCDRVAIINHGQIAAIDTPENLKQAFRRVQSVEVAFEPQPPALHNALRDLPGVTRAVKVGDKWRLYTQKPSTLLSPVVRFAERRELKIVSLHTLGPSLEDVFLEITGGPVGAEVRSQGGNGDRGPHKREVER